jgi:dTDP-4-dehydrorhamnose 3,5-epimerase-like enzyme
MLLHTEIIRTPIEDLIILPPTPIRDERGYFSRTLDVEILAKRPASREALALRVQL